MSDSSSTPEKGLKHRRFPKQGPRISAAAFSPSPLLVASGLSKIGANRTGKDCRRIPATAGGMQLPDFHRSLLLHRMLAGGNRRREGTRSKNFEFLFRAGTEISVPLFAPTGGGQKPNHPPSRPFCGMAMAGDIPARHQSSGWVSPGQTAPASAAALSMTAGGFMMNAKARRSRPISGERGRRGLRLKRSIFARRRS